MILREQFNFDGILVSVHGHAKNWRSRIKKLEMINGLQMAEFEEHHEKYPDDDLPVGEYIDSREKSLDEINPDEIPENLDYIAASKDCISWIDNKDPYRVFRILQQELKCRYSIHGEVSSPFDYLLDLLGYENALLNLMMQPEKIKKILQKYTCGVIRMAVGLCTQDIDAIKISSPFTGMGFISPQQYRLFEFPYISQIVEAIKNKDKFVYIHTCGHINDRLEIMRDTGADGLECLDPPPIGNVELEDAFNRIGKDMFIKGNIDPVNTLLNGTKEEISIDVKKRLEIGMSNPGFILSTACSIAPKVDAEKVKLLSRIVEENGYY
ncbi:Uroporphyrinogen decarboxylase [subsurface metagenome]